MWNFAGKRGDEDRTGWSTGAGMRIYVFGDIHGRFDLFDLARRFVAADLLECVPDRPFAVFLGDLIDRGPGSADVIEALSTGQFPIPYLVLRGNHEQMLLDSLTSAGPLDAWLRNGGVETLQSYSAEFRGPYDPARMRETILSHVPERHLRFLQGLPTSAQSGDYFFCHAGIRPDVPLSEQTDQDLMWIRRPFLESRKTHPKMVVHGHTPVTAPEILPNRINIDTGAYATGTLTCLVLDGANIMTMPVRIQES